MLDLIGSADCATWAYHRTKLRSSKPQSLICSVGRCRTMIDILTLPIHKPQSLWLALALSMSSFAQPSVPTSFDVAAIKPTPQSDVGTEWSPATDGRFSANGVTLKELISIAYGIQPFQVAGGPGGSARNAGVLRPKRKTFLAA